MGKLRAPGTMSTSDTPNWYHGCHPFPARFLTPEQGVKEGKVKSLVVLDPIISTPLGPDVLHLVMEQCRLQLNEQGGLVPTNPESSSISPSTTMGSRALRTLPTGPGLEVAGELHHTLVVWLMGEIQETGSPAPLVTAALVSSPLWEWVYFSLVPLWPWQN